MRSKSEVAGTPEVSPSFWNQSRLRKLRATTACDRHGQSEERESDDPVRDRHRTRRGTGERQPPVDPQGQQHLRHGQAEGDGGTTNPWLRLPPASSRPCRGQTVAAKSARLASRLACLPLIPAGAPVYGVEGRDGAGSSRGSQ